MHVQLYDVRVEDGTTRFFQVPKYDIPVIKELWKGRLKEGQRVTAHPMGVTKPRNLYDERKRMAREYRTAADSNRAVSAFQAVYPTEAAFAAVYKEAVEEGTVIVKAAQEAQARRNAAKADKPAPVKAPEPAGTDEAPGEDETPTAGEAPRYRRRKA